MCCCLWFRSSATSEKRWLRSFCPKGRCQKRRSSSQRLNKVFLGRFVIVATQVRQYWTALACARARVVTLTLSSSTLSPEPYLFVAMPVRVRAAGPGDHMTAQKGLSPLTSIGPALWGQECACGTADCGMWQDNS